MRSPNAAGVVGCKSAEARHAIERKATEDRLSYMAQFDALTGLPDRSMYLDRLGHTLIEAARDKLPVAMLFVDIDRFKVVNDATRIRPDPGHPAPVAQPKVDLATASISGLEALLRWQSPDRGLVSPCEFISVLEDAGLIVPVGEWVIASVMAIINLARSLKLRVIAEGVETPDQLLFLRGLRCDEVQGYHIARPMPVEAITRLLREGPGSRFSDTVAAAESGHNTLNV
jgi:EAL domain-containing protein (putative c-di-GMP-specific phosphodiesterase class I)